MSDLQQKVRFTGEGIEIKDGNDKTIMTLKTDEEIRRFDTGAVRDASDGKGRCDLLPMAALLRLSRHYEAGAKKYGERNWEKGQPMSVLLDSGLRHLFKYLDGWIDEDHLAAAAWNILGAMQMEDKMPQMQDIKPRIDAAIGWLSAQEEHDSKNGRCTFNE